MVSYKALNTDSNDKIQYISFVAYTFLVCIVLTYVSLLVKHGTNAGFGYANTFQSTPICRVRLLLDGDLRCLVVVSILAPT